MTTANVRQAVPFFRVADMARSRAFYEGGLGFEMGDHWIDEGVLRWCWLNLGGAAIMLQQFRTEGHDAWTPEGKLGEGVSVCFMCDDALAIWRAARAQGLEPRRPFVGNGLWVVSFTDPDGYALDFESPTDAPEETEYEGD